MDPYGIHFQTKKREANALDKLQKQWTQIEDRKIDRTDKLQDLDVPYSCCRRNCCAGAVEICFLRDLRRKFIDRHTQVDRKRFLIDLRDAGSQTGFAIVQGGTPLCYKALRHVLGVSFCLISSVCGTPRARAPAVATRRPRLGFTRGQPLFSKSDLVETFMHSMIDQFCDVQPDKGELHLPFGHRKDVYDRYMDECRAGNDKCPAVSKVLFYKVWKERCPFIKIRTFHRFAICPTCVEIQEEWHRAKTPGLKKLWHEAKQQHYNDVRMDRAAYHYRAQRCADFHDGISMVIDGAEFSSNGLPHFCLLDKLSQQGWKIKTKLYGAIVHGEFSAAYLYPDYQEGGSNVTIEVLHRTLTAYIKGDPTTGRPPKKLPPSLYLQLDNTVKECKNRIIFAYLKSLVDTGVFQHVYLSFLPVGHTHCDIDQMFSRIAVYMTAHSAYNFEEMARCLKKAFVDIQHVEALEKFMNFKDAVLPLLNKAASTPGLDHFDDFRFFHFQRMPVKNDNGDLKHVGAVQCKAMVTDQIWHDTRGDNQNVMPLFKDPHQVLDYESFWNVRDAIPPYCIPEQPTSTITQLEESLAFCAPRIRRTRDAMEAEAIIDDLQKIINRCKISRTYPFRWNMQLYRSPPRMKPEEYTVPDELLAQLQEKCMDKAKKRLEMETCVRIFKRMDALEPTHFIVVNAPAGAEEKFYIAEVLDNYIEDETLRVRWYSPSKHSKSRSKEPHLWNYELELTPVAQKGRTKGVARFKMDQRIQDIDYATCHFGFSKLKGSGALAPEVQRQLRGLKLAAGKITRT